MNEYERNNEYAVGTKVKSRDGKMTGELTGRSRCCNLEGCRGLRLGVRWGKKSGKPRITFPCTAGMDFDGKKWKII